MLQSSFHPMYSSGGTDECTYWFTSTASLGFCTEGPAPNTKFLEVEIA